MSTNRSAKYDKNTAPAPLEWPQKARQSYEPIRPIGQGGFAKVWMAKKNDDFDKDSDQYVAIKVVSDGSQENSDSLSYAKREIAIISELNHSNIVRLVESFKPENNEVHARQCIVLSLARGPTLDYVIQKGGCLGLPIAQAISRQLINAVAYMHGHAVIHRDIQPRNIIISGAMMSDDEWWSDNFEDHAVARMVKICHVTIIDFGFARALHPCEIDSDVNSHKLPKDDYNFKNIIPNNDGGVCINSPVLNGSFDSKRGRRRTRELDLSISKKRVRDLSALGTRTYAAPEILKDIRKFSASLGTSSHGSKHGLFYDNSIQMLRPKPLGECVSDYGMVADAFSIGSTIRHMVTGIPPHVDPDDFISSRNKIQNQVLRRLKSIGQKSVFLKRTQRHEKKFRSISDLSSEVKNLIQTLTHYDYRQRATVRSSTNHPWIKQKASETMDENERSSPSDHCGPIIFLQCALDVEKRRQTLEGK